MTKPIDVLALAKQLVRCPSITPTVPEHTPACHDTLMILANMAAAAGATFHILGFEGGHEKWGYPVTNLFVHWKKGNPKRHLCFLGHTDVVPVGDAAAWTYPPFGGNVANGYLYGRGATDMKGAVAAFFAAACNSISGLDDVEVSAIITTDEEWGAINGTTKVLGWMKEQGFAPDAFLVGEPSSADVLATHVKIGRRGSLTGKLIATGIQGHVAYPGAFVNPHRALSLALAILHAQQWHDATAIFPATQFEGVVVEGGSDKASNVVPAQATATWNVRYTPAFSTPALADVLTQALA
ncbi:MAG: M20/M25/M40 family metallo-hydrolase, partial [Alphaproteobacteria bacterium]